MRVYTIEQMRALERAADEAGHSYDAMMAAAGSAVAQAIEGYTAAHALPRSQLLVLAGPGNNGGDGLVAGRELARQGYSVVAYLWGREEEDDMVRAARRQQVTLVYAAQDEEGRTLRRRALARADIVIDALFGTGLSRPIEGVPAGILQSLRETRAGVGQDALTWLDSPTPTTARRPLLVAVDTPSGIHGDSGQVDATTVPADLTITFAGPKVGMLTDRAAPFLGKLVVADIGIPADIQAAASSQAELLTPRLAARLLPARPAGAHKGTFGTTLVVGGSINYVGAPALSALAAGRSGAGLVTLAVPAPIQPVLAARPDLTSATWLLLPHDMGVIREGAVEVLAERLENADALVLGPGLGSEEETQRFVWALLGLESKEAQQRALGFLPRAQPAAEEKRAPTLPPTVVDADGLNALAAWKNGWWEQVQAQLVLTPHPGEMGRLLERETSEIQAARLEYAVEGAQRFGQVVVLKGAHTVVAAPDGRLSISPYANDALAKAGAGDVLAGMIGALLGQGVAPYDAARAAVTAHGLAGARVRASHGGQGALASDLPELLPAVWQELMALREEE